jgi:hypothetical protein
MIYVYINYPEPEYSIHTNPNCGHIQKHNKPNQRRIQINDDNDFINEFRNFVHSNHNFSSNPPNNDMWIEINLNNHFIKELSRAILLFCALTRNKHFQKHFQKQKIF